MLTWTHTPPRGTGWYWKRYDGADAEIVGVFVGGLAQVPRPLKNPHVEWWGPLTVPPGGLPPCCDRHKRRARENM